MGLQQALLRGRCYFPFAASGSRLSSYQPASEGKGQGQWPRLDDLLGLQQVSTLFEGPSLHAMRLPWQLLLPWPASLRQGLPTGQPFLDLV